MGAAKANNSKDTYLATAVTFIVIGALFLIDKLIHFSSIGLPWVMNKDNMLLYASICFLIFKRDKSIGFVLLGLWLVMNIGLVMSLLGSLSGYLLPLTLLIIGIVLFWLQNDKRIMKRSIEDTPIVFIGAGNLATNLAKALYRKGFRIVQVYSRTMESARTLAEKVEAEYTTDLQAVSKDAKLYIVSLKDDALVDLLPQITEGKQASLLVHTAGSIPMSVWEGHAERYGVFYPMQTFSKQREVKFQEVPFFVEAKRPEDVELLKAVAATLSEKVYEASSEQRKSLHLAAVFICNFTNHMYALAADLLEKYNLPFDVMLPLIDETARKVHELAPRDAQTGPAVRYDENVMSNHLAMLVDSPALQEIYKLMSKSIHEHHQL